MIHLQQPVNGWLEAVTKLPPGGLVKAVTVQQLAEAKAANAAVVTFLRYVNDAMQHVTPSDTEATRENRARAWFDAFVDGTFLNGSTAGVEHWRATDVVGWWNEYYANSQSPEEKALWWKQERTAARIWRDEYRNGPHASKLGHIRLAIAAAAIGNDIPWQTAETATLYDCIVDYHAYSYWEMSNAAPLRLAMTADDLANPAGRAASMNRARELMRQLAGPGRPLARPKRAQPETLDGVPVRAAFDWEFLSGRWVTMDADFRNRGYTVDWIFGESGPFSSAVTGWRHEGVMNGHIPWYVEGVRLLIRDIKATNAYQTGRVVGDPADFTTGGGSIWEWFETRQPELNALADMVREEWVVVEPPPVDPPPAPSPLPPAVIAQLWQIAEAWPHKINFAPQLGLWQAILADGRVPYHTELSATVEGQPYAVQLAFKEGVADELHVWTPGLPLMVLARPEIPPVPYVSRPVGVDVSRWQGTMNWGRTKAAGAWYAFIKATEHITWVDPLFAQNWQGARGAGLLVGAYHFFRPGYDPIAQAEHFVATVKAQSGAAHLPFVLDVEVAPTKAARLAEADNYQGKTLVGLSHKGYGRVDSPAVLGFAADVQACLEQIGVLTGRLPLLYTGIAFWNTYLRSIPTNICQLWLANWTDNADPYMPKDWERWHFWQYTSSGNGGLYGAQSQRIDLNRWNGTLAELYQYVGSD